MRSAMPDIDLDQWARDGFVVVPGYLAENERHRLRSACDGVLAAWQATRPEDPEDVTNMAYLTAPRFHADATTLVPLLTFAADPWLVGQLDRLAGDAVPRFQNTQYFYEPARQTWDGAWHRDTQFGARDAADERHRRESLTGVHFRVALVDDPWFHIVPGSHVRDDTDVERVARNAKAGGALPGGRVMALAPGDALLFHAWSVHRGTYVAGQSRRTLDVIYEWGAVAEWSAPPPTCFLEQAFLGQLPQAAQDFYARFIAAHAARWLRNR
jgi:hypothetical protein